MPRKLKPTKPYICVFCEGASEEVYATFLKNHFSDVAVLDVVKNLSSTRLFDEAKDCFDKRPKFRNKTDAIDEIWFFFDVESTDSNKWDQRMKIIKKLRSLRKRPHIRIRLLMTTGCIEYWLMLHFKQYAPPLQTKVQKDRVIAELLEHEPTYVKGDSISTARIAERYPVAVPNAEKILHDLLADGLPGIEDTDERNKWLQTSCRTFSTVYEAIRYLESLADVS